MNKILQNIKTYKIIGNVPDTTSKVCIDSRQVADGAVFIAINGVNTDGHQYIDKAIAGGANIIVCEELPETLNEKTCYIQVKDSAAAAGIIASNYYDNPSSKIKVIGITGTNGKTTTATMLYNLFSSLGYYCGLISTVQNIVGTHITASTHTTPDPISLNELLAEMAEEGCEYCFMEVSSHAAHQKRISGIKYYGGIFTNITHDHLDYHKTFPAYIAAKKMFFNALGSDAFALTNIDDKNGNVMLENCEARKYSYGIKNYADFHTKIIEKDIKGTLVQINSKEMWLPLPGTFNVYNQTSVYATAVLCGIDEAEAAEHISNIKGAEGRFQIVPNQYNKVVIVDYAHTPDALENILKTLKEFENQYQRIICVFGAGGDRDKTKRPEMGEIAAKYSDLCIVTSDNPRSEDPNSIIEDIMQGVDIVSKKKVMCVCDRKEAIKIALQMMQQDDILLIAGKGHEKYQEIKGVKHHFDDVEIVNEFLK